MLATLPIDMVSGLGSQRESGDRAAAANLSASHSLSLCFLPSMYIYTFAVPVPAISDGPDLTFGIDHRTPGRAAIVTRSTMPMFPRDQYGGRGWMCSTERS